MSDFYLKIILLHQTLLQCLLTIYQTKLNTNFNHIYYNDHITFCMSTFCLVYILKKETHSKIFWGVREASIAC